MLTVAGLSVVTAAPPPGNVTTVESWLPAVSPLSMITPPEPDGWAVTSAPRAASWLIELIKPDRTEDNVSPACAV
jgi:hypothetical protein